MFFKQHMNEYQLVWNKHWLVIMWIFWVFVDGNVQKVHVYRMFMDGNLESDWWLMGNTNIDKFWEDGPSMIANNKYIIQIPQINKCLIWTLTLFLQNRPYRYLHNVVITSYPLRSRNFEETTCHQIQSHYYWGTILINREDFHPNMKIFKYVCDWFQTPFVQNVSVHIFYIWGKE